MNEPLWMDALTAEAIHHRQLAEHGGSAGVRDIDLLHSALGKPLNVFAYDADADIAALAASYAAGIIHNHPFVDGNKRTGFVVALTFLYINGFRVDATQDDSYLAAYSLAAGESDEAAFGTWLRARLVER